jgi:hypothetical protein
MNIKKLYYGYEKNLQNSRNNSGFFYRRFNKPFALLMTNAWLNDAYSKKVFMEANKQMQLSIF